MKKAIFLFSMLVLGSAVFAQTNHALVIGNGSYEHFSSLTNPSIEARQMAETLEGLGFEVELLIDATEDQMLESLYDLENAFSNRDGGIAFFHYGGHAVQVEGENYLIPVDAEIPDERRVRTRAVPVSEVTMGLDSSKSDTNIIILDACRDNPLPEGSSRSAARGLNVLGEMPSDSIVVYSARAGSVAQDGVFTPSLLKYLSEPREFTEILRDVRREVSEETGGEQIPGAYNELISEVYLAGEPVIEPFEPAAIVQPEPPLPIEPEPELVTPEEPVVSEPGEDRVEISMETAIELESLYSPALDGLHRGIRLMDEYRGLLEEENQAAADAGFWTMVISGAAGAAGAGLSWLLGEEAWYNYENAYDEDDIFYYGDMIGFYNFTLWGSGILGVLGIATGGVLGAIQYDPAPLEDMQIDLERLLEEYLEKIDTQLSIPVALEREARDLIIDTNDLAMEWTGTYDPQLTEILDRW